MPHLTGDQRQGRNLLSSLLRPIHQTGSGQSPGYRLSSGPCIQCGQFQQALRQTLDARPPETRGDRVLRSNTEPFQIGTCLIRLAGHPYGHLQGIGVVAGTPGCVARRVSLRFSTGQNTMMTDSPSRRCLVSHSMSGRNHLGSVFVTHRPRRSLSGTIVTLVMGRPKARAATAWPASWIAVGHRGSIADTLTVPPRSGGRSPGKSDPGRPLPRRRAPCWPRPGAACP